jgi:hypothetical protein
MAATGTTTYLVTLIDKVSGKSQRIIVTSECTHGMQEYVDELREQSDPGIVLESPVVSAIETIPEPIARRLQTRALDIA